MQLNSKSDNSTTENIKKIIAKEYNKNEHGLNLGIGCFIQGIEFNGGVCWGFEIGVFSALCT